MMIRFFYDMLNQGHSLHFCTTVTGWTTVVSPFCVVVRDDWQEHVKSQMDQLILYSDRKSVGLEELFGEVEEQHSLLPWETFGKIPLAKKDAILENLNRHPWLVPTWMESEKPEAFDAFFSIAHEVVRFTNRRRLICKDGPYSGDLCRVLPDARRHQIGDHVYEVVGNELVYLKYSSKV